MTERGESSYDVVVLGAGPGGTAAALRAAELGASVAVLEADRTGGTCVNSGCVPTRVLAKTARLIREVATADRYGVGVTVQHIDWPATMARVQATVGRVRELKREPARFAAAGVELVLEGRARFVDPNTLQCESGRRVSAESIIIAVGGRSRRLPSPGAELATVPEDVLNLATLPQRVAIIGSGHTGAQLTTIFRAFGAAVTLLDVATRVLMVEDADISAAVESAFIDQGVALHTGIDGVDAIVPVADGRLRLSWRAGGQSMAETFDQVVMATGWPAAVDDLGLATARVEVGRGAIAVDRYLRSTSAPHIFAVGDANGRDMLVQAAHFEGESAAEAAVLGVNKRIPGYLLPSGGFTDPDYASVGLTQAEAQQRDPECRVVTIPMAELDRAVIDDRGLGFLKLVADRRRELILGAHAVGENATEIVQSVTTAMAAGIDLATLADVRFAYPTYGAIVGAAARALQAR